MGHEAKRLDVEIANDMIGRWGHERQKEEPSSGMVQIYHFVAISEMSNNQTSAG